MKNGGLDVERYDADLEREIRRHLGFGPDGPLETLLKRRNVRADQLVRAFLRAVGPYAAMMKDLLVFFDKAGANTSNENLLVDFDFGKAVEGLAFDLDNFRRWSQRWVEVTESVVVRLWDQSLLWAMVRAFGEHSPDDRTKVLAPDARRWLREYEAGHWPEFDLPPPRVDEKTQGVVDEAWAVFRTLLDEAREASGDRKALKRQFDRDRDRTSERLLMLAIIDSDHWPRALVSSAYRFAEGAQGSMPASKVRDALAGILAKVPVELRNITQRVRVIDELLGLPIWRRRHELYSAWVGAQLVSALQAAGASVTVHQMGGRISYRFSGTHLATAISAGSVRLDLWAELRSPLARPRGVSRSGAIQPDYTLAVPPVSDPDATILVVECKQYLKQSVSGFGAALEDYARGRAEAVVALVNYGPAAAQSVLRNVARNVRRRSRVIDRLRPDHQPSLDLFDRIVRESLERKSPLMTSAGHASATPAVDRLPQGRPSAPTVGSRGSVSITWQGPIDLDLHAFHSSGGGTTDAHVSFRDFGCDTEAPFMILDQDVQTGGTEAITVYRFVPGRYVFAVHRYGPPGSLRDANPELRLSFGGTSVTLRPPAQDGAWWTAFALDANSGAIEILNICSDVDPSAVTRPGG